MGIMVIIENKIKLVTAKGVVFSLCYKNIVFPLQFVSENLYHLHDLCQKHANKALL